MPTDQLPDLVRRRVEAALCLDETVVWCGRPVPRRMGLRSAVMPGCVLVLLLVAVGVISAVDRFLRRLDIRSAFVSVIFWLACAGSVVVFLIVTLAAASAWWRAQRTGYVITNQRALVVLADGKICSYPAAALQTFLLVYRRPDGSGEILFRRHVSENDVRDSEWGYVTATRREVHVVGFLELADVEGPRRALEGLLGREVSAEQVATLSADYYHPL